MKSEQINDLAAALSKAQAMFKGAIKDANNPFFKSKYADLESIWEAAKGPLSANGLSVSQTTEITAAGLPVLKTTLMHSSGQWIAGVLPVNPVKQDPQGLGSAITYMRRYGLAAIIGITQTDDDGNAASGKTNAVKIEQPTAEDGVLSSDEELKARFIVPHGTYKKRSCQEVLSLLGLDGMRKYVIGLEESVAKKPDPQKAEVASLMAEFIAKIENQT